MKSRTKAIKQSICLQWEGKDRCILEAAAATRARFQEVSQLSVGEPGGNLIIEGDNLDALKLLQADYCNTVRAIYIDPPYNTNNEFAYHDSLSHDGWLSMIYPRLSLARDLLTDDGAIFVSIDDNEIDKLRLIMAEIFGEENFAAQITVRSNPRGRQAEKHFATVHEYILVFARNISSCRIAGAQLSAEESAEFCHVDSEGRGYRLLGLRQRGADSLREDRPSMYFPIYVDTNSGAISVESQRSDSWVPVLPKKSNGRAGRWMWSLQRVAENIHMLESKLIRGRNEYDIFVRDYVDDEGGIRRTRKLKTIWDDKSFNYQHGKREVKELLGECPVDYPKPLALLKTIIGITDDPNGLYLDFFAGTGGLAQAVLELNAEDNSNRRFILVQQPEAINHTKYDTIADICRTRVERVVEQLADQMQFHTGFRYIRVC